MLKFLGFLREEKGATAVEYALIVAVMGAIIVGAFTAFGDDLKTFFSEDVAGELNLEDKSK